MFALWVSPLTWAGPVSRTHLHVWAAILVGGIISLFPALLGAVPARASRRRATSIAVAQMLMGALLIHLTGGRIETHFHVFGSLAFLAFYRDWRVLVPATVVVALDHMLRGMFWPQSVYGVLVASQWRWVEHAAWVVFEDVFLFVACRRSVAEMRETAERTASLEQEVRTRQEAEIDARNARARNDAMLEVALDCVILMDESGRIVQFNPAAERTFGYSAAEAVGARPGRPRYVPPTARGRVAGGARPAISPTGETAHAEPAPRADGDPQGRRACSRSRSRSRRSPRTARAMFAGYVRDITERTRTSASWPLHDATGGRARDAAAERGAAGDAGR